MTLYWPLLSDERRLYAEVLEQIARDRLDAHVQATEAADELPPQALDVLVDNRLWAPGAPEERGGADADLETVALTVAHVATALPAAAAAIADVHVAVLAASSCAAPARDAVLDALTAGATVTVLDAISPLVVAETHDDGDGLRVCAQAHRADGAASAAVGLVLTDTRALVLSRPVWEQRSCGASLSRTGLRGRAVQTVALEDLAVSGDAVSSVAVPALRAVRLLLLAAAAVGLMSAAERHARAYAGERRQFGDTLDAIPAIGAKLERAAAAVRDHAASIAVAARALDAQPRTLEPAIGGLVTRTTAQAVHTAIDASQIFGGYGYLIDYPIERILRDAVSLRAVAAGSLSFDHIAMAVVS